MRQRLQADFLTGNGLLTGRGSVQEPGVYNTMKFSGKFLGNFPSGAIHFKKPGSIRRRYKAGGGEMGRLIGFPGRDQNDEAAFAGKRKMPHSPLRKFRIRAVEPDQQRPERFKLFQLLRRTVLVEAEPFQQTGRTEVEVRRIRLKQPGADPFEEPFAPFFRDRELLRIAGIVVKVE